MYKIIVLSLLMFSIACTPLERIPRKQMTVNIGPEKVFERPIIEMLPLLENAQATQSNGRIGNEMVFWGYRLRDNREVNLFACALLDDVNCEERLKAVCPAGGEELARLVEPGLVRQLDCKAFGVVGAGDLLPNCEDNLISNELLVGLLQC